MKRFLLPFLLFSALGASADDVRSDGGFVEGPALTRDGAGMMRIQVAGAHLALGNFWYSAPLIGLAYSTESPYSKSPFSPSMSFAYSVPTLVFGFLSMEHPWARVPMAVLLLLQGEWHWAPRRLDNLGLNSSRGWTGSLFVKNNVDPFLFGTESWIRISPGAGADLSLTTFGGEMKQFGLQAGFVNAFANDFSGRWVSEPSVYAKAYFTPLFNFMH